jgi:antitoxin (DNA-binding transcriptional repressor) of toxin-antitoxin stability system
MVVTNNGTPVAILAAVDETNVEESAAAISSARAAGRPVDPAGVGGGRPGPHDDGRDRRGDPGRPTCSSFRVRIVLDTSVVASALLSPFGPPARILGLVMTGAVSC